MHDQPEEKRILIGELSKVLFLNNQDSKKVYKNMLVQFAVLGRSL